MAVKLGNIARWNQLEAGNILQFGEPNRQQRLRIDFNTSAPTHLVAVTEREKHHFLAVVHGMQTIEFTTDGPVEIWATTEGEVWWYSRDGDSDAMELVHEVPFVKVMQRRSRNPELEYMMFKMNQNNERLQAQMRADFEVALAAARERQDDATENQDGAGHSGGENGGERDAQAPEQQGAETGRDESAGAGEPVPARPAGSK